MTLGIDPESGWNLADIEHSNADLDFDCSGEGRRSSLMVFEVELKIISAKKVNIYFFLLREFCCANRSGPPFTKQP